MLDMHHRLHVTFLRQTKDKMLGFVEGGIGIGFFIAIGDNFRAGLNKIAQDSLFLHCFGIVFQVGGGRHR
ncbi:MAG: hypothetical protein BWY75_01126 [bacterium ADurb.Bin425]|nr:MAG: hypothetical protein BWY75_01126 [bacterium ADurb.Bin425]